MEYRIDKAFAKAKAENRGAYIAYITAGFPSIEGSEKAIDAAIAGGADIIELGVPFSDPFADGPVIRQAAYKAIENGTTLRSSLEIAKRLRSRHPDTGIVVFTYCNPVFSMGYAEFAEAAANAGADAALVVDMPLEERAPLAGELARRGLGFIPLVAPNTPKERVKQSEEGLVNSFIYAITVKGVTGERASLPGDLAARLDAVRAAARLPVAAGFGISSLAQAREVCRHADGFVTGSAIVKRIAEGLPPCLD